MTIPSYSKEDRAQPGREMFEFWISFFPTAPLFGVEWRFAPLMTSMGPVGVMGSTGNPFLTTPFSALTPAPLGMPLAASASRPGELATPAAAPDAPSASDVAELIGSAGKAAAEAGGAVSRAAEDAADTGTREAASQGKAAPTRNGGKSAEKAQATAGEASSAGVASTARATKNAVDDTVAETAAAGEKAADGASALAEAAAAPGAEVPEEAAAAVESTGETALETTGAADDPAAGDAGNAAEAAGTSVETADAEQSADADVEPDAAEAASPPEGLLSKAPQNPDDLKLIKGIGPGLERQLNDLGVYRFSQIAAMSEADLAWIDDNLTAFKGRCFRDDWIGQAKTLLE